MLIPVIHCSRSCFIGDIGSTFVLCNYTQLEFLQFIHFQNLLSLFFVLQSCVKPAHISYQSKLIFLSVHATHSVYLLSFLFSHPNIAQSS